MNAPLPPELSTGAGEGPRRQYRRRVTVDRVRACRDIGLTKDAPRRTWREIEEDKWGWLHRARRADTMFSARNEATALAALFGERR